MSSTMYAICKQTHPPTGVEHSLYCHFYNFREKNLLVAAASQLQVFRLIPEEEKTPRQNDAPPKLKLECVQSFSLFGNIMCIQAVKLSGSPREAILLSFKDAKLSMVEYDPSTHDLKTLFLHNFEKDEMNKIGHTQHFQVPVIRVDPAGRCAAFLIYARNIAILSFRRDLTLEELEGGVSSGSKPPVASIYALNLNDLGEKIDNIIDIQFLHGYYDPTLLLLYEPVKTWPGRVAVRQDTCAMLALSLNIQQRVNPVIWSMSNLPFDCLQALPVPLPIGGVLIFAVNSLLYLNQSVPPFGVALNSFTGFSTAFPLKPQDGVKISLDCAQACFISYDKLVISLKGGELYVLTLFNDGMRSVRSFNFDKAAASVLTTCMAVCEEGYLFLGSRLGNSLLLRYTEKQVDSAAEDRKNGNLPETSLKDGPPAKKKKYDNLGDWMATDVALIEDPDELEVYGTEKQTMKEITVHTFEVCDSLLNIGPCGKICMGEPAFLSEEFANNPDPDIELVTTSGHGKNGALCILQRSVRPQVVTTFELPGCMDMWTVVGPASDKKEEVQDKPSTGGDTQQDAASSQEADGENEENGNVQNQEEDVDMSNSHAFLILSRADSTMVLQTAQEINELDHSGFSTQASTVFAGNMGNNKYIVQVSPMGVRLLEGTRQLQHIPLDIGAPIVLASLADPYLIILSEEGLVVQLVLRLDATGTIARFGVSRPQLSAGKATINTLCIYKDVSGLFTTASRKESPEDYEAEASLKQPKVERNLPIAGDNVDDEDELLYGDSGIPPINKDINNVASEQKPSTPKNIFEVREVKPTYWLFISRENGVLEVYSLPDYRLSYLVKNFPMGQKVLVDSIQMTMSSSVLSSMDRKQEKGHESMPTVQEMLMVGLGVRQSRPLLLVRVEDDLLIYEAFPFYETQTDNHLKLRFRKLPSSLIMRERLGHKGNRDSSQNDQKTEGHQRWLRCFQDISGYSGVFVCGPYPHWLFMTSRGELRIHPMGIDGYVTSFAPFHNVNCPKGFLYFNKQGALRISILPTHLTYDAPWPVRKVPLRSTPHFVNYHLESKTYCVVTSTTEPCNRLVRFTGDEKEYEVLERDDRYIYPMMDKFVLQLFSPVSWEMIPNTRIELEEWEHMTCLKNVMLASEGTRSGLKGYLAVGTNYSYGEDVTSRGRIIILDIIDVVPEPGQPLTKNKFKILYSKEQKGPVTALCQVVGFLLTAIGQKIYIWQLKNNDLVGVAFIDTQIYIHSAISIKNLILVADIYKSISLLQYQEDSRTLSLVSKDIRPLEVYGTEFLIDNSQLAFVVSDVEKNIILYTYQPEARESCGGQRLLRRGDIHVGSPITSFFRIRCRIGDIIDDNRLSTAVQKRHITMFATLDGSLGFLLPIPEKTYRRLLMLQNVLVTGIPHVAGLNPKGFRMYRSQRKFLMNPHKNILDGDLLWKYLNLSATERLEMARRIGTVSQQIMDDLMEIDSFTSHF